MYGGYFETKEQAEEYRKKHELYRLTDAIKKLEDVTDSLANEAVISMESLEYILENLKELKRYKDAEEQNVLLNLPVTIGDIVYRVNKAIIPMGVVSIEIKGQTYTFKEIKCKECIFGGEFTYRFSDIGTKVFLSKEEAEAKLNE